MREASLIKTLAKSFYTRAMGNAVSKSSYSAFSEIAFVCFAVFALYLPLIDVKNLLKTSIIDFAAIKVNNLSKNAFLKMLLSNAEDRINTCLDLWQQSHSIQLQTCCRKMDFAVINVREYPGNVADAKGMRDYLLCMFQIYQRQTPRMDLVENISLCGYDTGFDAAYDASRNRVSSLNICIGKSKDTWRR